MARRLSPEERALWQKVIASVRPLGRAETPSGDAVADAAETVAKAGPRRVATPTVTKSAAPTTRGPGDTLDAGWDRRLSRGVVAPDSIIDLHGHDLAGAYDLLDRRLASAIASSERLVLLVTGKPPTDDRRPVARGAIRAAVGDWLAASRHAGAIAAVRNAHPRHGGAGALYLILRRPGRR